MYVMDAPWILDYLLIAVSLYFAIKALRDRNWAAGIIILLAMAILSYSIVVKYQIQRDIEYTNFIGTCYSDYKYYIELSEECLKDTYWKKHFGVDK